MQNFYSIVKIIFLPPTENYWLLFKWGKEGRKLTLSYTRNHLLDVPQVCSILLIPNFLIHLINITQCFPVLGQGLISVPLSYHQTLQCWWVLHEIFSMFWQHFLFTYLKNHFIWGLSKSENKLLPSKFWKKKI